MSTLFNAIHEGHDSRNRVVFICKDPQGFYVFKPSTGFKTKHWKTANSKPLNECFDRQVSCGHQHGFYNPGEKPVDDENYSLEETVKIDKQKKVKTPAAPAEPAIGDPGTAAAEKKSNKN